MSAFLEDFAKILSQIRRDANVAKTWSSLVPLVCQHAGQDWKKGGLWLYDFHHDHSHLTLWHWWSAYGDVGAPPQHFTEIIPYNQTDKHFDDYAAHLNLSRARLEQCGLTAADSPMAITPIVAGAGGLNGTSVIIGLLVLFAEASAEPITESFQHELNIACGLVGSWMHLNREWRKAAALAAFQTEAGASTDIAELARSAVDQLREYASAHVAAAIYVPDRGELECIAGTGTNIAEIPSRVTAGSFLHRFHYGQIDGFRRSENQQEVQIEFDADGMFVTPESLSEPITLSDLPQINAQGTPISVLVARIRENPSNGGIPPPIATLMMATTSTPDFLGGRFSDTNRVVMRMILDAFRNSYVLAMQADRMAALATALAKIGEARVDIDINDDAADQVDFERFCRLVCTTLPNVSDAAVVFVNRDGVVQQRWRADGQNADEPAWLAGPQGGREQSIGGRSVPHWAVARDVEPMDGGRTTLYLLQTVQSLPVVEQTLLERILAELRIEQRRLVNKDDWARQLAEVRHNMRAVLASVIGKTELLGESYESALRARDPEETHKRLVIQGGFRKTIRSLTLAGKELEVIFENIRALVGKLDRNSLQVTSFELPTLIRNTLAILEVEAERRSLTFDFINLAKLETQRVKADAVWTRIALFNLLENAIKYSDNGGKIEVFLETTRRHWILRIENVGRYIPPDMRARIFEPYQRVQHAKGVQAMPGTGLGLMTVRQYVRLHQNRDVPLPSGRAPIVVESRELERAPDGAVRRARTSFTITLPRRGPDSHG